MTRAPLWLRLIRSASWVLVLGIITIAILILLALTGIIAGAALVTATSWIGALL
jgi:hypothetical protein